MGHVIGFTYNLKNEYVFQSGDPQDANAEFDHEDTIGLIEAAIRAGGHEVVRIGNAQQLLAQLDRLRVDIVFNLTEGVEGRNRESQVPILLEMMNIPYVGADGLTQGLTLDKVMAKKVLMSEQIPTPRFFEIKEGEEVREVPLPFPLIVKPRCEGSSKGLSQSSLVRDLAALRKQAAWLSSTYHQPALVEEFIAGTEFTVAILGNDPPQAQPVVQIQIDGSPQLGERFYTFADLKSETAVQYLCPAPASAEIQRRVSDYAVRAYIAVECRDFARVDLRVDQQGNPYVLEINPLPSLSTEDTFMAIARARGISYAAVINEIIDHALVRYGLKEVGAPSR